MAAVARVALVKSPAYASDSDVADLLSSHFGRPRYSSWVLVLKRTVEGPYRVAFVGDLLELPGKGGPFWLRIESAEDASGSPIQGPFSISNHSSTLYQVFLNQGQTNATNDLNWV